MTTLRRLCTLTLLTLAPALAGCETANDEATDACADAVTPDAADDTTVDTPLPPKDLGSDPGNPDLPPPTDVTDDADATDAAETTDATEATDTGLPPDCCHDDDDCPPNAYCVAGHLGAGGVCHTDLLPDGSCFVDTDCGGEELACKGAQLCSCDMNCVSAAGTCLPSWNDCCFTDQQCTGDAICAGEGPGGYAGVCKLPAALDGKCWDDQTCGN